MDMPYHEEHELPTFSLRQNDLPEILQWEVGGQYYVVMKVEMVGERKMAEMDSKLDRSRMEADFKVRSIRALGNKPIDPTAIEKADFEKVVGKIKSGEY